MPTGRLSHVRAYLRKVLGSRDGERLADGQLLERYVSQRERPPSRPWCSGTGRWSWACASACCPTAMTPRTPSRQRF
jgi:hypothetical protein